MKRIIIFLLIFLFIVLETTLFAQKRIYFCDNYTASGEPTGIASRWSIKSSGGNVYILYQNNYEKITTSSIYFFIDIMQDGEYKEYETKLLTPDNNNSWIIYDYKFTKPGDYRVIVYDAALTKLATDYVTITLKQGEVVDDNKKDDKVDTYYYIDAKVTFCVSVEDGKAVTPSEVFNIDRNNGGYVYMLVDNNLKTLKTEQLIVDIWMNKDNDDNSYSEFVETKYIATTKNETYANLKYTFYKKGKFKFSVFTKDNVWIQTGYVEINYK